MTMSCYKVLFVEDDENHYVLTRDLIVMSGANRIQLDWVSTYEAALESMVRNDHDAYLLDYRLGRRDGLELLEESLRTGCRGPIIMLTGYAHHDLDIKAMRAGAADYLVKGQITADLLERSLRYAIERQRSAEALRASQEFTRSIIDCSLDMIIAVDNDRRITEFNLAAQRTFGYPVDEVLGKRVDVLYASPDEGLRISEDLVAKQGYVREIWNVRKNGEFFPCLVAASLLRDTQGQRMGAMGISRDITQQKKAEVALRQLNEDLERRVRERTLQLENANRELQAQMAERQRLEHEREEVIRQLSDALGKVKTLGGLLPICSHCKKIRDDKGYWNRLEDFISSHSGAEFTHGICPECTAKYFPEVSDQPVRD
jgi:PAS domain S-box-containing protein